MKTLKCLLLAGLALAGTFTARAEISAQAWLETYYLNPQPDALIANIRALSRDGYFEQPGHVAIGIGFLATIFAQHPARVEAWLGELKNLPASHQRLVAAAVWQSGHPLGATLLRQLSTDSADRSNVLRLADTPAQLVTDTAVRSPSSMNLQWGAFLASGEERHITRIFDAIGMGEPALDQAARVALAQNAAAHPRVMEICLAQLSREPNEVQSVLRAAVNDAASHVPRS